MASASQPRNWGDPWIGLRYTTVECLNLLDATVLNPMPSLYPLQTPFGSPDIWEDIASFFTGILFWVNPVNWVSWVYNSIVLPAWRWLRDNFYEPFKIWFDQQMALVMVWFGRLWDAFADGLWRGTGSLYQKIKDIYDWFYETAASVWGVVADNLSNLYVWASITFNTWVEMIKDNISQINAWFRDTFQEIAEDIRDYIETGLGNISAALSGVTGWIYKSMRQFWWWLGARLNSLWTWLGTIMGKVTSGITGAIDAVEVWFETRATHIVTWWNEKFWPWLSNVFTAIVNLPRTIWQWLLRSLKAVWEIVSGFIVEAADKAIALLKPVVERWAGAFQSLPATFLNWVATTAGTNLALEPHRALTTTGSLYMMAMAAGTGAHVLSTALNAIPATNWVGASQLSAYIAQAAGFEELTQATYGVLINEALTQPLRYYWNAQLRPHQPTEGAIFTMGRKRGLTRGEFGQAMAKEGLPEWWIDKEYQFFWSDPSPYWLLRMSEHATPEMHPSSMFLPWLQEWLPNWRNDPWAWFKMKLMLAGFEDTDIPAFIEGFQSRRLGPAITQVKTSVRAMLREGYWDRTDAAEALTPLRVRTEEVDYMVLAEELDYQKGFLDDQVRLSNESFRKGEISSQDLSMTLSLMIVKPERVAQIVAREQVRALPKPKSVVLPKEDPLVKSLVRQAMNSWTKAYRDWAIEIDELRLGLTIVLQNVPLADQMATVERTRFRPEPPAPPPPPEDPVLAKSRRASIASWVKNFRDGKIPAAELELGLSALIADASLVRQIRQIEELRARPAPEIIPPWEEDPTVAAIREETIRGHIEMFRKRLINIGELYTCLVSDGLVAALAKSTAITQALKRIKTPPLESPYFQRDRLRDLIDEAVGSYTRMLELGQITLPEYESYLAGVGVDPELITYIGDTQALRRFCQPGITT